MTTKVSPLTLVLILSGLFFAFFLAVSGFFYLSNKGAPQNGKLRAGVFSSEESVGVVEINGVIMDSKKTLEKLDRIEEDSRIKAVVLRLNSPGGAVAPSQEIYEAVEGFSKPIVVSMSSVAASGAYYIAAGAKKIFANPGTLTGSIGVIMEFTDLGKLYDWAKINRYSIKAGKFKDAGADYRSMTPEEKALIQTTVDDVLDQFKAAVMKGRSLTVAQISQIADGRIFTGRQAKAAHLVDELGSLDAAIDEAGRLGQIKGKPHVISFEKRKRGFLDLLLSDESSGPDSLLPGSLLGGGGQVGLLQRLRSFLGLLGGDSSPQEQRMPGIYGVWGGV